MDAEAKIAAADEAIQAGDLAAARHHLAQARSLGAPAAEVTRIMQAIDGAAEARRPVSSFNPSPGSFPHSGHTSTVDFETPETAQPEGMVHARTPAWVAFLVAVFGYFLLSIRQPAEWTPAVWAVTAFVLIPAVAGLLAGRSVAGAGGSRFWRAYWIVAIAMGAYTLYSLSSINARIANAPREALAVELTATVAYAILAGLVAGLVGAEFGKARTT